jgi:FMN reductase
VRTAVVVGNPKPRSRTLEAATLLMRKLTGADAEVVLDLIEFGPALLEFGHPAVAEAISSVQRCNVVVVASPTFKATYTGILKLFLDQIPADGLAGVTAFPLMLGGGPAHALAPDLLLKPVLVELGAICPAAGLYLLDKNYAEDPKLDLWVSRAQSVLPRVVA